MVSMRNSGTVQKEPAPILTQFHPRRHTKDGEGPRKNQCVSFVRFVVKNGASFLGQPCGRHLQLLAIFLFSMGTAFAAEVLSPFEDPGTHLWGYRNPRGAVVIAPRFSVAQDFSNRGIAAVADDSGWKYINRQGKTIIRPYLLDNGPDPFREGLARFKEAGKFGFFNERGKVIIPARFAFAAPFSEGRAVFCQGCRELAEGEHRYMQGGLWGFIDRKGRIVITPRFDKAESFQRGKARVMLNGRWITIDPHGHPTKIIGE
jgi:hypothetical protein